MSAPGAGSHGSAHEAPPLAGLRVLELATGLAGPWAGRLLAMLGATVVKVEPAGGDPLRRQPIDDLPVADPGPLFVHANAGKRLLSSGAVALEEALVWADVVLDGRVRAQLVGTPLHPEQLRERSGPVLVTTSAWGFEADVPGEVTDELLVQAAAGVMSATGDPDGPPLRFPGFQSQYVAGGYAAFAALAALRSGARHVDVSWVHCVATGVEASWARNLQTDHRERPSGPNPLDVFPSGALPCADGFVVAGTVRPADWAAQCRVYERPDLVEDERFRSRSRRRRNHAELWAELRPWYLARPRAEIFRAALDEGWALGMVLRGSDALRDPHLEARGFLDALELPGGRKLRAPARPWLAPGLPAGAGRLARAGEDDAWFAAARRSPRERHAPARRPLEGLRVLELTQAWAGPFVGRLLGALGADVVKVESARRPDGWRGPSPFGAMAPHLDREPDALSVEISANFNALNRNKRHCAIDLTARAGRALFLELVAVADVVVANMTARVLPQLRLDYEALRAANESIILVNMPALGATGPFRDAVGYGTIVEGMGGFGALFGAPEEGARISNSYYPDPVAGLQASLAVLAMLERRDRTGRGGEVDLSHQEALWLQLGEALVRAQDGGDVARLGNAVPGAATSGVYATRDGRWVAVASRVACEDLVRAATERDADDLLADLAARGAAATEVRHFAEARHTARMAAALETVTHEVTGERPYLRVPLRIDGAPIDSRLPSPTFDRHTREVIGDWLGRDAPDLEPLLASGAVGGAPDPDGLRAYYLGRSRR